MQAQQLTIKGFHEVCLGGEVRNNTGACVGANTMKSLSRYHFSKGFFGTNGIDLKNGLRHQIVKKLLLRNWLWNVVK